MARPSEEHDRGATLANESAMARRDLETKVALLSKVADEAAQFRQTADAAAAELRQSLLQESERVADLTRDLATARRDLETKVALSSKVADEAAQVRQTADAAAAELRQSLLQERERVADLTRDLASDAPRPRDRGCAIEQGGRRSRAGQTDRGCNRCGAAAVFVAGARAGR